jgi:hypothetical protein
VKAKADIPKSLKNPKRVELKEIGQKIFSNYNKNTMKI